jgi:hypothetical protein
VSDDSELLSNYQALEARYLESERDLDTARRMYEEGRAENKRLREALVAAENVMWMAESYAEAGGSGGPEWRDYTEATNAIRRARAALLTTVEE